MTRQEPPSPETLSRRALLTLAAVGVGGSVAGCGSVVLGASDDSVFGYGGALARTATPTPTPTPTTGLSTQGYGEYGYGGTRGTR